MLVYRRASTNNLSSALLLLWHEIVTRNLFGPGELDDLLPVVTDLLDGSIDVVKESAEDLVASLGMGLLKKTKKRLGLAIGVPETVPKQSSPHASKTHERTEYNEHSVHVMRTKILATELFNLRLEHEAVESLQGLIAGFKEEMANSDYGPSRIARKSSLSGALQDARFVATFKKYVDNACSRPYMRHNRNLLPICLDLASYQSKELANSVLAFCFKSMWFGAELAVNLQQTQILFSDESWVLFRDLTTKRQRLETMLLNMSIGSNSATEEERCRGLLGYLVSLLQPKNQLQEVENATGHQEEPSPSANVSRHTSFRRPGGRSRRGSTLRKAPQTPQVLVNHAAVLSERQDICRNLGFHELVAHRVLTLPLSPESVSKRGGRWELIQLSYHFLRLLCHDHAVNQEAVAEVVQARIMDHLEKNVGADELVRALYREHYQLANTAPPELVKSLVVQLVDQVERQESGSQPADVLRSLLVTEAPEEDGRRLPVPRNQALCMTQLLERVSGLKIHDNLLMYVKAQLTPSFDRRLDGFSRQNRQDGMPMSPESKPDDNNSFSTAGGNRYPRRSTVGLCNVLEVLSLCCQGRNTATEIGAASVMPLDRLLHLLYDVLSCTLDEPPPRMPTQATTPDSSPIILGKADMSISLRHQVVPVELVAKEVDPKRSYLTSHGHDGFSWKKTTWTPHPYLVSVLLQFLHNVFLNDGGQQLFVDVRGNFGLGSTYPGSTRSADRETLERASEWSTNDTWWGVFKCFSAFLTEWRQWQIRANAQAMQDKQTLGSANHGDSLKLKRAPTLNGGSPLSRTPPNVFDARRAFSLEHLEDGNGGSSTAAGCEREREGARMLIFYHIIPSVGTYVSSKFVPEQFLRMDSEIVDFIGEFVNAALSLYDADCTFELTSSEMQTLHIFFSRFVGALLPSDSMSKHDDIIGLFPMFDAVVEAREKLEKVLKLTKEDASSPRTEEMNLIRMKEGLIINKFCEVQDYLLEAFTEDVQSLGTLLLLIREQMETSNDSKPTRWLTALVSHLEDPDLPEQVITGLLKVFTRLITTAAVPLAKIRAAALTGRPLELDMLNEKGASDRERGSSGGSDVEVTHDFENIDLTMHHIRMQNKLNKLGLTSCMVKLTERGNGGIAHEAICFGVALLHGGNRQVQDSMLDFFLTNDESFFESMKDNISIAVERLVQRTRERDLFEEANTADARPLSFTSLGSIGQVLRLLQLVCEGHHLRLQNYIRLQEDNLRSTNVVREVLLFLRTLMQTEGLITESSKARLDEQDKDALLQLAQQTFDTLTEFCQGPCPENQNEIVACNICGLVDGLLQAGGWDLLELKSKAITTLLSVLEGCGSGAGSRGQVPPSVAIMLRTLKLETIENTLTIIWGFLKSRKDEAGNVFRKMDENQRDRRDPSHATQIIRPGGAAAATIFSADDTERRTTKVSRIDEPVSHYVYEDAWMEQACEVLGVVEHVEAARAGSSEAGASLCDLLDVSFNLYILLLTLSSWSPEVAGLIDLLPGSTYFKRMVGTIEIARGSVLEKVYFRIPSTCSGLSRQARHKVLWDLRDKESRAAKLAAFFETSGDLIAEMKYLHFIRSEVQRIYITRQSENNGIDRTVNYLRYRLGQFFTSPTTQDSLQLWNVRAGLVVNTILLLTYSMYEFRDGATDIPRIVSREQTLPTERLGHGLVFLMPSLFPDDSPLEVRNYCFICGLESSTFERYLRGGFKSHSTKEHNMWNYLYFHHHLLTKKEDEFTGQESYVWERIQELDFSFYPINKSMSLMELGVLEDKDGTEHEEEVKNEVAVMTMRLAEVEATLSTFSSKLASMVSSIESIDNRLEKEKNNQPRFPFATEHPFAAQAFVSPGRRRSRSMKY
ncbi:Ryanodine receptor [Diplonema papillatum]|nr:Ryanodine receptor [Diplonema papillatum]